MEICVIDVFMASEGERALLVKIRRNRNMRPGRLSEPIYSQRYSQSPWIRDHGRVIDLAEGAGGHNDSKETESVMDTSDTLGKSLSSGINGLMAVEFSTTGTSITWYTTMEYSMGAISADGRVSENAGMG